MTIEPDALPAALQSIRFDNSYARELSDGFYASWRPAEAPSPALVALNGGLAAELGLDADALATPGGVAMLAGSAVPPGAQPIAQAYAGHQFGGFSPQLGDGRALLLGEVIDVHGARRDLAFKGSGRTPFSRGGDGKAAIGPALREYLLGEAMHALGIPTTRVLAVVTTGERVMRDRLLPGAVLVRVASSHLRVGTFEYFAAREDTQRLRRLADYAVARHDADLVGREDRYLELLRRVTQRQASLIARWMGVGFIHGVMNTDNMTISGETIDYGPCAFLEAYDPKAVFSSIDTHGRYAFGNQPAIAQWNLARLAEALLPLIHPQPEEAIARATPVVEGFVARIADERLAVMRAKLGLDDAGDADDDVLLIQQVLGLMQAQRVDHTLGFRRLVDAARGDDKPWLAHFADPSEPVLWLARLRARWDASAVEPAARAAAMQRANPMVIPRNHRVEEALDAATLHGDHAPFHRLLAVLKDRPFDDRADDDRYVGPAPPEITAGYRTFCGT